MKIIVLAFQLVLLFLAGCSTSEKGNASAEGNADSLLKHADTVTVKSGEETEEEETERLAREKATEDEKAFAELGIYDGNYSLHTESEGAEGTLVLKYKGDKVFTFRLDLKALDICEGNVEGEIFMDRTQHGLHQQDSCLLHFNFMGNWDDRGYIIEIEQPDRCNLMQGDCIFTGKYITGTL